VNVTCVETRRKLRNHITREGRELLWSARSRSLSDEYSDSDVMDDVIDDADDVLEDPVSSEYLVL